MGTYLVPTVAAMGFEPTSSTLSEWRLYQTQLYRSRSNGTRTRDLFRVEEAFCR